MFGHRYFGGRYFAGRYFGDGAGVIVTYPVNHFGRRFFGGRFFGARYYGGGARTTDIVTVTVGTILDGLTADSFSARVSVSATVAATTGHLWKVPAEQRLWTVS